MSAGSVEQTTLTLPALLVGGSIGLVIGAASLGMITAAGSIPTAIVNSLGFLLAGYLFLFPVGIALGWPLLRTLRRRDVDPSTSLVIVGCGGLLAGLVVGLVLGWITGSVWNALLAIVPATLCCVAPALLFALPFSRRPRLTAAAITTVTAIAIAAAAYFLIQFVTR